MKYHIDVDFFREIDDDEIIFSMETNEYIKKIRMGEFYFEEIMDLVPPENGDWTEVARYHQYNIGWEMRENWKIPDIKAALLQFKSIKMAPDYINQRIYVNGPYNILKQIIIMLEEAIEQNADVYISKR
jgi:hypothetical protein